MVLNSWILAASGDDLLKNVSESLFWPHFYFNGGVNLGKG
jgi:uncharacterized membrane protein